MYLHGICQHPCQPERDFLWEFLSGHGNLKDKPEFHSFRYIFYGYVIKHGKHFYLEAIAKVNVKDLSTQPVQHQI